MGAEPLPVNGRMFGVYAHTSSNVVGLLGQLRLSFFPGVDFGFQGGLSRQDLAKSTTTTVRLGADIKASVRHASDASPIAVSVGGNLAIESGDGFHILTLGPTVVASRAFHMGTNGGFTPYARVGLAFANITVGPFDDTDFSLPIRLGGDFRLSTQMDVVVELQLQPGDAFNDATGLAAGVNFPF